MSINAKFGSPLLQQLRRYTRQSFIVDSKAGITVGVLLIPQAMAYALLAGMPPIYGLYAALIPILIYAFLGTSPQLSIGPVAISSILLLSGISAIAAPFSDQYISLVILAGLCIGVVQLCMGLLRIGYLVNFLSQPVIAGFTSAAAILIVASQFKDMIGISVPYDHQGMEGLIYGFGHIGEGNGITILIFSVSLIILMIFKKVKKAFPIALLLSIVTTFLSYIFDWGSLGVSIIGAVPAGLPRLEIPTIRINDLELLAHTIVTVSLIGVIECISIAKSIESRTDDHTINANRELVSIGIAKIGGSLFQSLPSSASFSRSALNLSMGARTQVSSLIAAGLVLLTLLFLTPLFEYMPKAVLAAIILQAVIGLVEIHEAQELWRTDRQDLLMMLVTFATTLVGGIETGILIGVMLSLAMVLYQSSKPQISILGQVPDTEDYRNIERFEDVQLDPNMLIVRFENQLYFGNVGFFRDKMRELVDSKLSGPSFVILDATAIHHIDSTGIKALRSLDQELQRQNIHIYLAGARGILRDRLKKEGLMVEPHKHHNSIHAAVRYIKEGILPPHYDRAIQANY